jgi:hypothetical protein
VKRGRGRLERLQRCPHASARKVDEPDEALRGLVVSRSEAAVLLQAAEEALHEVTLLEDVAVILGLDLSRRVRADDRRDALRDEHVAYAFGIVCRVGEEHLTMRMLDQLFCNGGLVGLARRELDVDRLTESVHESVDLGGKTSARPANSISVDPPFPPAACW